MKHLQTIEPGTKILFANFPADGHFNPLTGLAYYLKNKGCDVRWYTSETYEPKVRALGIPFYGLKRALDITKNLEELFPDRNDHKSQVAKLNYDMINVFIRRGPETYQDLKDIYQDFRFDLVVADIGFTGIAFLTDLMKIPVIGVSVFPLCETSKDLPPYGLAMHPSTSFFGRMKQAALRWASDHILFAKSIKEMGRVLGAYGIDTQNCNVFDLALRKSTAVLQSGTPGFEYTRSDMSSHIHFCGPLLPKSKAKSGKTWYDSRLTSYTKKVLVTQGTVEKDVTKLLVPALEAFKDTDTLLIVTTGGSETEKLRKQYNHSNIIIEDFIAFDEVMPYINVYLSNGGYGGVLLSIQNQVPLVVAGVHEGKNEINARVGYFNLGINLKTETPSPEALKAAVEEVMTRPVYRSNVIKLSTEFSNYQPEVILGELVAELVRPRQRVVRKYAEHEIY